MVMSPRSPTRRRAWMREMEESQMTMAWSVERPIVYSPGLSSNGRFPPTGQALTSHMAWSFQNAGAMRLFPYL